VSGLSRIAARGVRILFGVTAAGVVVFLLMIVLDSAAPDLGDSPLAEAAMWVGVAAGATVALGFVTLFGLPLAVVWAARGTLDPLARPLRVGAGINALILAGVGVLVVRYGEHPLAALSGPLLLAFAGATAWRVRASKAAVDEALPRVEGPLALGVVGFGLVLLVVLFTEVVGLDKGFTSAMRRQLRRLAESQEAFYRDSVRYTEDSTVGGRLERVDDRVSAPRITLTADGWSASVTHQHWPKPCVMYVGTTSLKPARAPGEPACVGLRSRTLAFLGPAMVTLIAIAAVVLARAVRRPVAQAPPL
jgi:hypothetical protein